MKFFLTLMFILSGMLWLNIPAWADDEDEDKKDNTKLENDFNSQGCKGSANAEAICGDAGYTEEDAKKQDKSPKTDSADTTAGGGDQGTSTTTQDVKAQGATFAQEEGNNPVTGCWTAPAKTEECCADPTTCLGSEALSTLEQVNTAVTMAGPGVASALTGFGKDMSGMCSTIQKLAGAGAALSLASSSRCKAQIGLCNSTCDKEIKQKCTMYWMQKRSCVAGIPENQFESARNDARDIIRAENNKSSCKRQRAKVKDWGEKMGQMLNSALSAELCKRQAGLIKSKKECKAAGREWKDGECLPPKPDVRIAQCEGAGGTWNKKTEKCTRPTPPPVVANIEDPSITPPTPNIIAPDSEKAPSDTINQEDPDNNTTPGGGGGDIRKNKAQNNKKNKIGMPLDSTDDFLEGEGASSGGFAGGSNNSSGSQGGMRGFFRRGGKGYGGRRKGNKEDKDPNNYKMGGGGFGGYAGGGRGGRGGGDFANLKLSKKQLDEIAKKKGAMRKINSQGFGGAHENIFARITRRFKALCQKDIDCR